MGIVLAGAVWAAAPPPKAAPKPLRVTNAILHQGREDGAAISSSYEFIGGELLYLSFQVANYTAQKDLVQVRYQLIVTDPEGVLCMEPVTGKVEVEMSENDKNWLPRVRETIPLPPLLPSGVFHLKIHVADEYSKTSAEETIDFGVRGRSVAPAEKLVIRDFMFYRTEDEREPAVPPVFRGGDPIFARFLMTGFKLGEKNKFEIGYGIRVLRPNGSVLFEEPKAAEEADTPFYPKRFLLGGMSLNLSKDVPAGEYIVVVMARDGVGGQTLEERFRFEVR